MGDKALKTPQHDNAPRGAEITRREGQKICIVFEGRDGAALFARWVQ